MANSEVLDLVCVAIEASEYYLRDVHGLGNDFGRCVSETMSAREIDNEHLETITRLAGFLISFADSVRLAEQRNKPIIPILGQRV